MMLIDNFKTKYPRYWSVWCNVAAVLIGILGTLEYLGAFLPLFETRLPPVAFFIGSIVCTAAGLIARAIKQSNLNLTEVEVADAPAK